MLSCGALLMCMRSSSSAEKVISDEGRAIRSFSRLTTLQNAGEVEQTRGAMLQGSCESIASQEEGLRGVGTMGVASDVDGSDTS
jgi:hypothetical protein